MKLLIVKEKLETLPVFAFHKATELSLEHLKM